MTSHQILLIPRQELARGGKSEMEMIWSELQTKGIEVEETEISQDEFERLFCGEKEPHPTDD
jgi:hypothetical protein